MKEIPLTQGKVALVDDDDFEWLSQWKWRCDKGYAVRTTSRTSLPRKRVSMHREIANTPSNMQCDHVDRDSLNNTRANLRNCSSLQNTANRGLNRNNTSGYKGVTKNKDGTKLAWKARIRMNGRRVVLLHSNDPVECAKAYDKKAREIFGEFARTNFND